MNLILLLQILSFQKIGNIATIHITHNKNISRVKYYWNEDDVKLVDGNSRSEIIIDNIDIPSRNKYAFC